MVFKLSQTVALAFSLAAAVQAQSGSGRTTRYWDCCKPSCSWSGKAQVNQPVQSCNAQGSKLTDANARSGCDGGGAFACTDNSPWAINSSLAYGFAAVSISGSNEGAWCCECYELTYIACFTSGAVAGQKMVVQATNTGGDLGANHFDLMIPGGGVGIFNGCVSQFGSWNGGAQYGGVSNRTQCDQLPAATRQGCYFRFDWFKGADNPDVTFKKTTCPSELIAKSGCKRNDAAPPTTVTSTSPTSSAQTTKTTTTTTTTSSNAQQPTATITKTATVTQTSVVTTTAPGTTKTVTVTAGAGATVTKTVVSTVTASCPTSSPVSVKPSSTSSTKPTPAPTAGATVAQYAQCDGSGFAGGRKTCASPYKCTFVNAYYSQCL